MSINFHVEELVWKRSCEKENAVRRVLGLPALHSREEFEAAAAAMTTEQLQEAKAILSGWVFLDYADGRWEFLPKDEADKKCSSS